MLAALHEWLPRHEAAKAAHRAVELNEAWENFGESYGAREALIKAPAPDIHAVAHKLRTLLDFCHCGETRQDVDSADTLSELLSEPEFSAAWGVARVYQDVLRLAGLRPDLVEVQPFDAKAWIEAFETIPGHEMRPAGPAYMEPEAWGPGCPSPDDLLISDPVAIANYRDQVRAKFKDPQEYDKHLRAQGHSPENSVYPPQREALEWAYSHDPAERDRMLALWDRRAAHCKSEPQGAALWRGLTSWQRDLIKQAARTAA
jgi:hypothetical protein